MTARRFLVDRAELPAAGEATAVLRGPEHHHLSRVLRMKVGESVSLFDGAGRGLHGTIESIERDRTIVRVTEPDDRAVEPALQVILAQGIPKHDKMDLIIQKTTEIGVAGILPIIAERSTARAGGGTGRLARWRRIAAEAARQSGRLMVPQILEPSAWPDVATVLGAPPAQTRIVLDTTPGAGRAPIALTGTNSAVVAVGPEGGWSESELGLAGQLGFTKGDLGSRTLRTETAGILSVGILLFLAGDLGARPSIGLGRAAGACEPAAKKRGGG